MQEILKFFYQDNSIDEDGKLFLSDRGLSVPNAISSKRVATDKGFIYFLYDHPKFPPRYKARNMTNKKNMFMSSIPEEMKADYFMTFWNAQNCSTSGDLIITEGELDCLALTQLGASNVVSLPNGASSVESSFRSNYEFLQKFDRIFIAFDNDGPGNEAAEKAKKMLPIEKFRRLSFVYKDANEWVANEPTACLDDLVVLMQHAPGGVDRMFCPLSRTEDWELEPIDIGFDTPFEDLNVILGGLRKGEVTVVSAETGAGKTTFCFHLMYHLANNGVKVWINSYEMKSTIVIRKLVSKILKKDMKLDSFESHEAKHFRSQKVSDNLLLNKINDVVDLNSLEKFIERSVMAYNIEYILLDHLDYINVSQKKTNHYEAIDEIMKSVHIMAVKYNVGILMVVHPKQKQQGLGNEVGKHDLKGSASIKQYSDNLIFLSRVQGDTANRVKVSVAKNRLLGKEASFHLNYVEEIDGYESTLGN